VKIEVSEYGGGQVFIVSFSNKSFSDQEEETFREKLQMLFPDVPEAENYAQQIKNNRPYRRWSLDRSSRSYLSNQVVKYIVRFSRKQDAAMFKISF